MQKEDDHMEDFMQNFKYSLKILGHSDLDKGILKIILLHSLREESMKLLNVVGNGDNSKEYFDTNCEFCVKFSQGVARHKQGTREAYNRTLKSSSSGVPKA